MTMQAEKLKLTEMPIGELLGALVSFPSLSTEEGDLVDWLTKEIKKTGLLETERVGDNLMIHYGKGRPWLLLNSHSDVVPPSPDHEGSPFDPVIIQGRMYGRGTTDAKASSAAMIKVLLELAEKQIELPGRVTFALTVCEEAAGDQNGMAALREHWGEEKPDAAIVGEPTLLEPCIAQKGLLILRLITRGRSGHAARVYGENAIYRMTTALQQLSGISFDHENPHLGPVKITPTTITGGTANNANPEYCETQVDIRTIPEVPIEKIVNTVTEAVDAEVVVKSDRLIATGTGSDAPIAQAARQASEQEFFGSPTSSDWVFLNDIPTVKMGPGDSNDSHTRNESIALSQLQQAVNVYRNVISAYYSDQQVSTNNT